MDEVYRGYRIAIRQTDQWTARITHVRGTYIPLIASASLTEGPEPCLVRARVIIDKYIEFLEANDIGGEPN